MAGTEVQATPPKDRAKILPGIPKEFAKLGMFCGKGGKRYIAENMTLFILSRRAFLEKRLDGSGGLFREEIKKFIRTLFDEGKATAVEFGDMEEMQLLAAPPYGLASASDAPEKREINIDIVANFCRLGAESDLDFLNNMKMKFFQHVPVSETEEKRLKEMEQDPSYSRYFRTIN